MRCSCGFRGFTAEDWTGEFKARGVKIYSLRVQVDDKGGGRGANKKKSPADAKALEIEYVEGELEAMAEKEREEVRSCSWLSQRDLRVPLPSWVQVYVVNWPSAKHALSLFIPAGSAWGIPTLLGISFKLFSQACTVICSVRVCLFVRQPRLLW